MNPRIFSFRFDKRKVFVLDKDQVKKFPMTRYSFPKTF